MKSRTTQKEVRQNTTHIIKVSYCGLQQLLKYEPETHYTTRTGGWASDVYFFGSVAISTGYASFGDIKPPYELIQKYEKQAYNVGRSPSETYQETKAKHRKLIDMFIEEVTQ